MLGFLALPTTHAGILSPFLDEEREVQIDYLVPCAGLLVSSWLTLDLNPGLSAHEPQSAQGLWDGLVSAPLFPAS